MGSLFDDGFWHLAFVENSNRGIGNEARVQNDLLNRNDQSQSVYPGSVSFDAAVEPDAIPAYRLDLSDRCIKVLGHAFHYFPPHEAKGNSGTSVHYPTQEFCAREKNRFRGAITTFACPVELRRAA
jgi:hypothetical protein